MTLQARVLHRCILLGALALLAVIVWRKAQWSGLLLDFIPVNGDFQTYNPLRRMAAGQTPGVDFLPYFGLGPNYLLYGLFYWAGGTFGASKFIAHALHLSLYVLFLAWPLWLLTRSRRAALSLSAAACLLVFSLPETLLPYPVEQQAIHGNSMLGLRSLLPVAASMALYALLARDRLSRATPLANGLVLGLLPLWSNDYGLTSLAVFALALPYLLRGRTPHPVLTTLAAYAVAALTFAAALMALTHGQPGDWWHYNYTGIAQDQFWYYGSLAKLYGPADLFRFPVSGPAMALSLLLLGAGSVALLWHARRFNPRERLPLELFVCLAATCALAALLSSAAGTMIEKYFSPALHLLALLAVYGAWRLALRLPALHRLFTSQGAWLLSATLALVILTILPYRPWAAPDAATPPAGYVRHAALGGFLPERFESAYQLGRRLGARLSGQPAEARVFSTYATLLDEAAGAFQPTRHDYIIHALGDRERQRYLQRFLSGNLPYATTPHEPYTRWESWSRRVNWWFYRELLARYEPVTATSYNLLWQHKAETKPNADLSGYDCRVTPSSNHEIRLHLTGPALPADAYLDIALEYRLRVTSSGLPYLGARGLVSVVETVNGEPLRYSLPPRRRTMHMTAEWNGRPTQLTLQAFPSDRATLTVTSCRVLNLFPKTDTPEWIAAHQYAPGQPLPAASAAGQPAPEPHQPVTQPPAE